MDAGQNKEPHNEDQKENREETGHNDDPHIVIVHQWGDEASERAYYVYLFQSKEVRHAFLRKVYGVLTIQMIITLIIVAPFILHQETRKIVLEHPLEIFVPTILTSIIILIIMSICAKRRRHGPCSYFSLCIFTICFSISLGPFVAFFYAIEVLIALGIMMTVFLGLTIFVFQTRLEFNACFGIVFSLTTMLPWLFVWGLVIGMRDGLYVIITIAGVLSFCSYMIFNTRLMMLGFHRYPISPDDPIFAALNLYLDFINLFKYILEMFEAIRQRPETSDDSLETA